MVTAIVLWALVSGTPTMITHWKVDATTPSSGAESVKDGSSLCNSAAQELRSLGVRVWCVQHIGL